MNRERSARSKEPWEPAGASPSSTDADGRRLGALPLAGISHQTMERAGARLRTDRFQLREWQNTTHGRWDQLFDKAIEDGHYVGSNPARGLKAADPDPVELWRGGKEALTAIQAALVLGQSTPLSEEQCTARSIDYVRRGNHLVIYLFTHQIRACVERESGLVNFPRDLLTSPYDSHEQVRLSSPLVFHIFVHGFASEPEQIRLALELWSLVGCRIGELMALVVGQVQRKAHYGLPFLGTDEVMTCHVTFAKQWIERNKDAAAHYSATKTGRRRKGEFPERVWEIVMRLEQIATEREQAAHHNGALWQPPEKGVPLIVGIEGRPLRRDLLHQAWHRALLRAGLPPQLRLPLSRTHLFRHLYMCLLLEACGNPDTVADIMAVSPKVVKDVYATVPNERRLKVLVEAATLRRDHIVMSKLNREDFAAEMADAVRALREAAADGDVQAAAFATLKIENLAAELRRAAGEAMPVELGDWFKQLALDVARLNAWARRNLPYPKADADDRALVS